MDSAREGMFMSPATAREETLALPDSSNQDYNSMTTQFFSFGKRKCSEAIPSMHLVNGLKKQAST